jgi:hypothetical protein
MCFCIKKYPAISRFFYFEKFILKIKIYKKIFINIKNGEMWNMVINNL